MTGPKYFTWPSVCCRDVAWNLEKSLVGPNNVPVHGYSHCFPTRDMEPNVEALSSRGPSCAQDAHATPAAWQSQRCPLGISSLRVFPPNMEVHGDNT
ncbi:hypothetical protein E2I00_018988 [Balaenoptera physalus]|uniref:Uncharacterized protein n=1 Tax=Balaenoptera physalus TaxID=9770 RepID=A0A6A1Q0B9_BALPH|nr:hypothetical protein E2I00_018988 [Balaenoptera physalus]